MNLKIKLQSYKNVLLQIMQQWHFTVINRIAMCVQIICNTDLASHKQRFLILKGTSVYAHLLKNIL